MQHASSQHFGHVEVAKFDFTLTRQKDVSTFEVSVTNVTVVHGLQAEHHLAQDGEYFLRRKQRAGTHMLFNAR